MAEIKVFESRQVLSDGLYNTEYLTVKLAAESLPSHSKKIVDFEFEKFEKGYEKRK